MSNIGEGTPSPDDAELRCQAQVREAEEFIVRQFMEGLMTDVDPTYGTKVSDSPLPSYLKSEWDPNKSYDTF